MNFAYGETFSTECGGRNSRKLAEKAGCNPGPMRLSNKTLPSAIAANEMPGYDGDSKRPASDAYAPGRCRPVGSRYRVRASVRSQAPAGDIAGAAIMASSESGQGHSVFPVGFRWSSHTSLFYFHVGGAAFIFGVVLHVLVAFHAAELHLLILGSSTVLFRSIAILKGLVRTLGSSTVASYLTVLDLPA